MAKGGRPASGGPLRWFADIVQDIINCGLYVVVCFDVVEGQGEQAESRIVTERECDASSRRRFPIWVRFLEPESADVVKQDKGKDKVSFSLFLD